MPGLTPRLLLITALIVPLNCYFLLQMELVRYTFPTWVVPLSNVVFILSGLLVVNGAARRIAPAKALSRGELLVLYVMLSLTTSLSSGDVMQAILSVLPHGFWFATPENEYRELFWHHIPRWLTVSDPEVLRPYYRGDSSLYVPSHVAAWAPVVLAWTALFAVLGIIYLCLSTILQEQWSEHERLTYPITHLPLAMTDSGRGFFRSKALWVGLAVALGISLLNGLHEVYPALPRIPVTRQNIYFRDGPLKYLGQIIVAFYPFASGIMYLVPLELLLSTTLFCALYRFSEALGDAFGWHGLPRFPYPSEQALGGFLALCLALLWVGKSHFSTVLRQALRSKGSRAEEQPMTYSTAVWGLLPGMVVFATLLHYAGMSLWLAISFSLLFLVIPVVTTRIRAEGGVFVHAYHHVAPRYAFITALGTRRLGARNLTALSVLFFNRDYRAQEMPHQLEAFAMSK